MNKYPYTEFNTYNLDWLIRRLKELEVSVDTFEALNSITFGGNWSIDHQYTKWTIVNHPETHDAYMSLQPVPVNVPITNEDYWLKIGDYTDGLAVVDARVDALEDWKDETVPVIEDHEERIAEAEVEIDNIKNRKILIFGDSYFMNSPIGGGNSVLYYLNAYKENNLLEFDVKSDGSEGFSIAAPNSFEYDVQRYVSRFDAEDVTDVAFCGGYNDRVNNKAAIEAGMRITFELVRSKYPNARIHVGHFGWSSHLDGANRQSLVYMSIPAYANCAQYGASFMTNSQYTMHYYELFYTDNIHPTQAGRQEIAKQILHYFLSGSCDVHYQPKSVTFNNGGPTALWTNSVYTVSSRLDNDLVTIYLPHGNIVYTSAPFDLSTSSTALLGLDFINETGYRLHFIGNWSSDINASQFSLAGNFRDSDGYFHDFSNVSFFIREGSLFCRCHKLNAAGTNYGHVQNVAELNLNGQAITIPALQC